MMDVLIVISLALLCIAGYTGWRGFHYLQTQSSADWGGPFINAISGALCLFVQRYHRLNRMDIPLPQQGGALLVSNHVSGLDPLVLIASSSRPLRFLIAREEYQRFGLKWLFRAAGCIPVEREKRPERSFRAALLALSKGEVVALFPQGKIHVDRGEQLAIKAGAVRLAELSQCPIYSARIEGVRGAGFTLLALLIPSRVRLFLRQPFICEPNQTRENLNKLAQLISQDRVL